jgi:hypothetical protein
MYRYCGNDPVNLKDPTGLYISYGCGSQAFWDNYRKQYAQLMKSALGRKMLALLENSSGERTITEQNPNNAGAQNIGSTVLLKDNSNFQTLAHEFQHAISNLTGDPDSAAPVSVQSDADTYGKGSSQAEESEAVRAQNIVKREVMEADGNANAASYPGLRSYTYGPGDRITNIPYPFGRMGPP